MVPEGHRPDYDAMIARRGGGPIKTGPTSVMINSPRMTTLATALNDFLVTDTVLSKRLQELAILTAARAMDCQQIWNSHVAAGRKEGLRDDFVDGLRDRTPLPKDLPEDEAAAVNYGQQFFATRQVTQEVFNTAQKALGTQALAELTGLMGYYAFLAFFSNAFDVGVPGTPVEPLMPV
jgi:4-carboxymuconolactone decarboxylase